MKDLKGFLFHFSFATTIATALLCVPFMIAATAAHAAVIDFSTVSGYSDGNLDAQPSGGTDTGDVSWDSSDWKVVGERAEITSSTASWRQARWTEAFGGTTISQSANLTFTRSVEMPAATTTLFYLGITELPVQGGKSASVGIRQLNSGSDEYALFLFENVGTQSTGASSSFTGAQIGLTPGGVDTTDELTLNLVHSYNGSDSWITTASLLNAGSVVMSDSFAWSAAGGPAGWSDADKYLQLSAANIGETTGVTVLFEELRMSRVLPAPGYTAWAAEWGLAGSNASKTVDVDRDGLHNLFEYAYGGNPTNADAHLIEPFLHVLETDGNWEFHFVHNERTDDPDLSYSVETRPDLHTGEWDSGVAAPVTETAAFDSIKTVASSMPMAAGRVFARLSVETAARSHLYVAPSGHGAASGSSVDPYQTVQQAVDALAQSGPEDPARATVWFAEGRYDLSSGVMIDANTFSSHPLERLDFRALPGHEVVFSGGVQLPVSEFASLTDSDPAWNRLDAAARGQVLRYDLAAAGITDYGTLERHGYTAQAQTVNGPMQLIVDGQVQQLARWPNDSTVQMDQVIDPGPIGATVQPGGTFSYAYSRPETWTNMDDVWVVGVFGFSWEWSYNKVAALDTVNKTVSLAYGEASGINQNFYPDFHHYENVLEELDVPGEYYIDRPNGVLYYYPDTDFSNAVIEVTMLQEPMFHFDRVSNITVEGISFETSRREFILSNRCERIRISDCTFKNSLEEGINLQNTKDCRVENSLIHHVGKFGIDCVGWNFGFGDAKSSGNVIENCELHNTSQYEQVYNPAIRLVGQSNTVRSCTLHSLPHAAIIFIGNDHLIEYNEIHSVAREFNDFGAIYAHLGGYAHHRGTRIANNYIHHIGESIGGVHGVYSDGATMGLIIEQNLFHAIDGPHTNAAINLNTASDAVVRNNLFVDCETPVRYSFHTVDVSTDKFDGFMMAWYDQRSVLAADPTLSDSWYSRYPILEDFYNRIEEIDADTGIFPIHSCLVSDNTQLVADIQSFNGNATSVTLDVAEDLYVNENGTRDAISSRMISGDNGSVARQSFLKFDLSPIQSNWTIQSATLRLYHVDGSSGRFGRADLYRLVDEWDAATVTIDHPLGSRITNIVGHEGPFDEYKEIDVTSIIQGWQTVPTSHHGFSIQGLEGWNSTYKYFVSSEGAVGQRPELVITYTLPNTTPSGSILYPGKEEWRDRMPDAVTETATTIALEGNQVVTDNDRITAIVPGAGAPTLLQAFSAEWFDQIGSSLD